MQWIDHISRIFILNEKELLLKRNLTPCSTSLWAYSLYLLLCCFNYILTRLKRIKSKIAREAASKTQSTSKTQNTSYTQNTSKTQISTPLNNVQCDEIL